MRLERGRAEGQRQQQYGEDPEAVDRAKRYRHNCCLALAMGRVEASARLKHSWP
jgi:hypothetical protein